MQRNEMKVAAIGLLVLAVSSAAAAVWLGFLGNFCFPVSLLLFAVVLLAIGLIVLEGSA